MTGGYVFDTPALLDAAGGWPTDYVVALITVAARAGRSILIPSTVRAAATREATTPGQVAELDWFLARTSILTVVALAETEVSQAERLAVKYGELGAAHVALIAERDNRTIITSWDRKPWFTAEGLHAEDLP